MSWETLYLGCFYFGLVTTMLAFVSGAGHLHLHVGRLHLGMAHGSHGQVRNGMHPVNLFSVLVFLCWFGGLGYLLQRGHAVTDLTALCFAISGGLAAASLVMLFLVKVLQPSERLLLPEDTEMRGVLAKVSSSVRAGGTGEILFSLNGTRRCAAAKSEDGALQRGQQVLVLRYERGIAWVRPWTELDDVEALAAPPD